jgi:hypothetical protein
MKHARVLAPLETTFPVFVLRRWTLVCAYVVFLHLKYNVLQDDNLSRSPCILKGFWNFVAWFFVYLIAGLKYEMGGPVACMGHVYPGSLTKCQGHYDNYLTVPPLALALRMRVYTSISTRLCRILMD